MIIILALVILVNYHIHIILYTDLPYKGCIIAYLYVVLLLINVGKISWWTYNISYMILIAFSDYVISWTLQLLQFDENEIQYYMVFLNFQFSENLSVFMFLS